MILVLSPEVVHDARPVVVHPSHETSAPVVVIERSRALRFVEAVEGVLQLPASVHCHEPDTTPLVEEACYARVDEFRFRCTICAVTRPTKSIISTSYHPTCISAEIKIILRFPRRRSSSIAR